MTIHKFPTIKTHKDMIKSKKDMEIYVLIRSLTIFSKICGQHEKKHLLKRNHRLAATWLEQKDCAENLKSALLNTL